MKKMIWGLVALTVLVTGCVAGNDQSSSGRETAPEQPQTEFNSANLEENTEPESYSIITETFKQGNVNVRYPQISGLGDGEKEKAVNQLISDHILYTVIQVHDESLMAEQTLELNYRVTAQTPGILSVLYTGSANIEGSAFATNNVYSITIDLENVMKLRLSDFAAINEELAEKIKQSTNITSSYSGTFDERLLPAIKNEKDDYIISGLTEELPYYTFCVTPDSLIVSIAISHADGDYVLIEVPGEYIRNYSYQKDM